MISDKRRMASVVVGLLAVLLLTACGTATFDNTFLVVVDDPSKRLGSNVVAVSIFDDTMGFSREWADQTMGTTSPGTPYAGSVTTIDTKMIFDSTPPKRVVAGFAMPAYTDKGSFQISLEPTDAGSQDIIAPFVAFDENSPAGSAPRPLPMTVTSVESAQGWTLHVTVHVPPEGD